MINDIAFAGHSTFKNSKPIITSQLQLGIDLIIQLITLYISWNGSSEVLQFVTSQ